jgi:hypothetical protein
LLGFFFFLFFFFSLQLKKTIENDGINNNLIPRIAIFFFRLNVGIFDDDEGDQDWGADEDGEEEGDEGQGGAEDDLMMGGKSFLC